MKFYDNTNGRGIAKANFLTNQIANISILEKSEKETVFNMVLYIDNLLPIPPVKNISTRVEFIVFIAKEHTFDCIATLDNGFGMIESVVKFNTSELSSLLCYMVNYCENKK